MAKLTKRQKLIREKLQPGKQYAIGDALSLLKELSTVKFTESVDVAVSDATLTVSFDESEVGLDSIKSAIEEQGYAVFG